MIAREDGAVDFSAAAKSAEWHEARRGRIGGSDAGVIAGSPWKTTYQLWLEKSGMADVDQAETEAMYWGSVLEDAVVRRYCDETGHKVRRQPLITSKSYPWMVANVDRQIVGEERGPGILEVKTTNAFARIDELNDIPDAYYAQLQHYLMVTGYSWGAFAVLIGGNTFRRFEVVADPDYQEILLAAEVAFWGLVESGIAPDVTAGDAAFLGRQFPTDSGVSVTLEGDAADALRELPGARERAKEAEEWQKTLEARIKGAMGDASEAVVPGFGSVTWKAAKPTTKTRIDEERLKADGLYETYAVTTTTPGSRRFLVKVK